MHADRRYAARIHYRTAITEHAHDVAAAARAAYCKGAIAIRLLASRGAHADTAFLACTSPVSPYAAANSSDIIRLATSWASQPGGLGVDREWRRLVEDSGGSRVRAALPALQELITQRSDEAAEYAATSRGAAGGARTDDDLDRRARVAIYSASLAEPLASKWRGPLDTAQRAARRMLNNLLAPEPYIYKPYAWELSAMLFHLGVDDRVALAPGQTCSMLLPPRPVPDGHVTMNDAGALGDLIAQLQGHPLAYNDVIITALHTVYELDCKLNEDGIAALKRARRQPARAAAEF